MHERTTKYKKHRADKGFREFSAFNKLPARLTGKCSESPTFFIQSRYRAFKMTRQLTIILIILTFVSCQNSRPENKLTKLEKYITDIDTLTSDSETFDQIANHVQAKRPNLKQDEVRIIKENKNGLLKEKSFRFYHDTTGKHNDLCHSIRLKEYESNRQAAEAFREIIEFHACCIPDEDIVKLKNFKNLDHFKNSASTTILTENIVIEMVPGDKAEDNKETSELLDEILKGKKYLKLEIGHGGPAIWTRK